MSIWGEIKQVKSEIKDKSVIAFQKHKENVLRRSHERQQHEIELNRKIEYITSLMTDVKYLEFQKLMVGIREELVKSMLYDKNDDARIQILLFDKLINKPKDVIKYYESLKKKNDN